MKDTVAMNCLLYFNLQHSNTTTMNYIHVAQLLTHCISSINMTHPQSSAILSAAQHREF